MREAFPIPLGSASALGLAGPNGTPLIGELPAPADPAGGVSCAKACAGAIRLPSARARTSAELRDIQGLSGAASSRRCRVRIPARPPGVLNGAMSCAGPIQNDEDKTLDINKLGDCPGPLQSKRSRSGPQDRPGFSRDFQAAGMTPVFDRRRSAMRKSDPRRCRLRDRRRKGRTRRQTRGRLHFSGQDLDFCVRQIGFSRRLPSCARTDPPGTAVEIGRGSRGRHGSG